MLKPLLRKPRPPNPRYWKVSWMDQMGLQKLSKSLSFKTLSCRSSSWRLFIKQRHEVVLESQVSCGQADEDVDHWTLQPLSRVAEERVYMIRLTCFLQGKIFTNLSSRKFAKIIDFWIEFTFLKFMSSTQEISFHKWIHSHSQLKTAQWHFVAFRLFSSLARLTWAAALLSSCRAFDTALTPPDSWEPANEAGNWLGISLGKVQVAILASTDALPAGQQFGRKCWQVWHICAWIHCGWI